MKFAEKLLDRFDAVSQRSQDGIDMVKDMLVFFKKRQAIEDEYSKQLQKLSRSVLDQKKKVTSVNKGGIWDAWITLVTETEQIGILHKQLSVQIGKLLVEAYQNYTKEMENNRKQLVTEGTKFRDDLQEAYTNLKRAKDAFDRQAKEIEQAEDAVNKATATKKSDLPKLQTKALQAREKGKGLTSQVDTCSALCNDMQELFYKKWMPSLMDRFQTHDLARIRYLKDTLNTCVLIEGRLPSKVKASCDRVAQSLEEINPEVEQNIFIAEQTGTDNYTNCSVSSLQGDTKKGRVQKLIQGANAWKNRFMVLMAQQQRLYVFESEDSLRASEVLEIKNCRVRSVHESLYSKKYCFAIRLEGGELSNFSAEDEMQELEWIRLLKACSLSVDLTLFMSQPRRIHSLSVHVIEGKGLPPMDPIRRSANPYCSIWLDSAKYAATTTFYNSVNPLWNERIFLDDIPKFNTFSVRVFSQSPFKDIAIGLLEITRSSMESSDDSTDQWLPLSMQVSASSNLFMFSDIDPETMKNAALRIRVEFKSELVFPLLDYKDFVKVLLNEDMVALSFLMDVAVSDRDMVARLFVRIWHTTNCALSNLRKLIHDEIDRTDDPLIIFRGNSLATKATDQFMKTVAGNYLQTTLSHVTQSVISSKASCEVDASRMDEGEDIHKNCRRLLGHTKLYLEAIFSSVENMPSELRFLCNVIQEKVIEKYPNDAKTRYTAVSGFIFLRLICPVILAPKVHGLTNEIPDERSARTLTLIVRILQNMANVVESGGKESMGEIATFITENIPDIKKFIDDISVKPKGSGAQTKKAVMDVAREVESIRGYFVKAKKEVAHHTLGKHPSVTAVYEEIQKLVNKAREVQNIEIDKEEPISPTTLPDTNVTSIYAALNKLDENMQAMMMLAGEDDMAPGTPTSE